MGVTIVPEASAGAGGSSAYQAGSVLAGGEGSSHRASWPEGSRAVASWRAFRASGVVTVISLGECPSAGGVGGSAPEGRQLPGAGRDSGHGDDQAVPAVEGDVDRQGPVDRGGARADDGQGESSNGQGRHVFVSLIRSFEHKEPGEAVDGSESNDHGGDQPGGRQRSE